MRDFPALTVLMHRNGIPIRCVNARNTEAVRDMTSTQHNRYLLDYGIATVERYEPAVPKCATCNRFSGPGETGRYGWCKVRHNEERTKPRDGSGYCDEHSELRHG